MDFEDFKLEPLSEGLGFHKKKVNLDSEVKKAGFVDEKLTLNIPVSSSIPIQPKKTNMMGGTSQPGQHNKPLFKNHASTQKQLSSHANSSSNTLAPFKDRSVKFSELSSKDREVSSLLDNKVSSNVGVKFHEVECSHSFTALVFDFFVVSGLFLTASFMLFVVTDLNMDVFLTGLARDPITQGMMATLFFSISIFYLVLSRSVTFCTLGEWALDMKLGNEKHRSSVFYPIKVFLRSFIILITGVLPITLLSLVRRKDCLRRILPLVKTVPSNNKS